SDGAPKLLFRLWADGGLDAVREAARSGPAPRVAGRRRPYTLITGGAGFIGSNLANRLLSAGKPVLVYDDLSRPGAELNLSWLRESHGERLRVEIADIRN